MASDVANAFSDIGGAVSSLFGASGATASARSYDQAAAIAEQNAQIAKEATTVKELQESRLLYRTIGKQRAGVAGAGFSEGGTALDILQSSASEGALTRAIISMQGSLTENSYAEQAGIYKGMADSARTSSTGQTIGGIIQGAGGLISGAKFAKGLFDTAPTAAEIAPDAAAIAASGGDYLVGAGGAAIESGEAVTAAFGGGAEVVGAAATVAESAGFIEAAGEVAAVAAWVVCTELRKQGRMPSRVYYSAAQSFIDYPERGKRGYYIWAIPSTRHLRAYPDSLYSHFLETLFNCRANYIHNRRRGKPASVAGALVAHGLYAFCWSLSWFVPESFARWQGLYSAD